MVLPSTGLYMNFGAFGSEEPSRAVQCGRVHSHKRPQNSYLVSSIVRRRSEDSAAVNAQRVKVYHGKCIEKGMRRMVIHYRCIKEEEEWM